VCVRADHALLVLIIPIHFVSFLLSRMFTCTHFTAARNHPTAGFVVEETCGKNSIVEIDDGQRITVSNVHIRTCSTTTDDAVPYASSAFQKGGASRHSPQSTGGGKAAMSTEELMEWAFSEQTKIQEKLDRNYGY
jgi:hypothetical protein